MNREVKREMDDETPDPPDPPERPPRPGPAGDEEVAGAPDRPQPYRQLQDGRRERTGPQQFLREVRGELKRVAWPSRREVASYSLVVLIVVALFTVLVFALDQAFGQLVFVIFG